MYGMVQNSAPDQAQTRKGTAMTPLPQIQKTASAFVSLMEDIWAMNLEAGPNGSSILLPPSYLYDDWHHAVRTAKYLGAVRSGGTLLDGEQAETYRFPDGSKAIIAKSGGACRVSYRKTHNHK